MLLLLGNLIKVKQVLFFSWDWQQHLLGWRWEVSVPVSHAMILLVATDLTSCTPVFYFSLLRKLLETLHKGLCHISVVLPIPWNLSDCHDPGICSTDQSSDTDWLTPRGKDLETSWHKMPAIQQWDLLCIISFKTTLFFSYLIAWSRIETA